jgi:glycosyltransferase involved in cell wall biosynthesis/phosphoheptose isomerase
MPKDDLLPHMDAFAEQLAAAWKRERPDIVHAHFWMSAHAALRAAAPLGIPVVQTFHALGVVKRRYQGDHDTSPPGRLAFEKEIVARADHVIATCTDELFELIRLGAANARLTVIPCGADLERFKPDGPSDRRRAGTRRLLCVGRLVERKGIGNAIEALAQVPDTELVIAGGAERSRLREDPDARRLLAVARAAGVERRVDLRGRVDRERLPALLRSADAVVCAPWYEPFGIVPLEAMACGVPVVASAVGGMIDTVVDGVTGLHVPPRDPERLAATLRTLLDDPAARDAYGRAGVRRARRLYDWERIATATLDVYARLARQAPRPRRRPAATRFELPPTAQEHLALLAQSLERLECETERLSAWGGRLAAHLLEGGRLLAVGNGGSAAHAQHLTAELVGRYHSEREPLSAICLHADSSSLTAISNDYGLEEAFARQVRAHGRRDDVLLAISTSGGSPNVLAAARAARDCGLRTWALTGAGPNALTTLCDDAVALDCGSTATVQELHQVAIHLICGALDREVALRRRGAPRREHAEALA